MTPTRASMIAALLAVLGAATLTPAFAAPASADAGRDMRHHRLLDFRQEAGPKGMRFVDFTCAPSAAERLEKRLDHMEKRLSLTTDQAKLFDVFKTSALTAQTSYFDSCATILPERAAVASKGEKPVRPNLIERMETGLKLEEVRLKALGALLPDLSAFYKSLTPEQRAQLEPRGFGNMNHMHKPGGPAAAPGAGMDG